MGSKSFVLISIQGWTDMWVSKHWIAESLAKHGEVYFVEPFRGLFLPGRGAKLRDFFHGPRVRSKGDVQVVSMSSLPGHYSGPGWYRALSRLLMWRQVDRLKRKLQGTQVNVLTFDCRGEPIIRQLKPNRTVYYAIDPIPPEKNDPWWREEHLIHFVDKVLAISERHRRRVAEAFGRKDIVVVPHGVDFAAAREPKLAPADLPAERPLIGYTGSIHDTYVDFDLIREAAMSRPEWSFVFVGPTKRNALSVGASGKIEQLMALDNVSFLGPKPYAELPSYIAEFDVCIMPYQLHIDNEPFKTLNYFAQGKPVVASDVLGVSEYKDLLYTFRTADQFVECVEAALSEPANCQSRKRRIDFARHRDFSVVSKRIVGLFGGSGC